MFSGIDIIILTTRRPGGLERRNELLCSATLIYVDPQHQPFIILCKTSSPTGDIDGRPPTSLECFDLGGLLAIEQ